MPTGDDNEPGSGGGGGGAGGGSGDGGSDGGNNDSSSPTPTATLDITPTFTPTPTPMPTPTVVVTPTISPEPELPHVSSLTVTPNSANRSLSTFQTATVTVLDQNGQKMSGVEILAIANKKRVEISPNIATTNNNGIASFEFKFKTLNTDSVISFVPADLTASISQSQNNRTLQSVNSYPNKINSFALSNTTNSPFVSSLTVNPTSANRSFTKYQTAAVTALDQNGQPIPGVSILPITNKKRVKVIPSIATTDNNGTASFEFKFKSFNTDSVITFVPDFLTATINQIK